MVQLRRGARYPFTQVGRSVTAAIATGGGTLGGTLTATTTGTGVASFTNLSISGTAGDRTLSFSATGLTSVTSTAITITAGSARLHSGHTQPSAAAPCGVAFAPQPAGQVRDGRGNPGGPAGGYVTAGKRHGRR